MGVKTDWQLVHEGMLNYSIKAAQPETGELSKDHTPTDTTPYLGKLVSFAEPDGSSTYPKQFRVGNLRLAFKDERLVRLWIDETQGVEREFSVKEYKPDFTQE